MSEEFVNEIMDMFEFCGCGCPDCFVEQLYEYLKLVEKREIPDDKYVAYMYLADNAGLTEHGSSVYGAWLSEKGKKLLKKMEDEKS